MKNIIKLLSLVFILITNSSRCMLNSRSHDSHPLIETTTHNTAQLNSSTQAQTKLYKMLDEFISPRAEGLMTGKHSDLTIYGPEGSGKTYALTEYAQAHDLPYKIITPESIADEKLGSSTEILKQLVITFYEECKKSNKKGLLIYKLPTWLDPKYNIIDAIIFSTIEELYNTLKIDQVITSIFVISDNGYIHRHTDGGYSSNRMENFDKNAIHFELPDQNIREKIIKKYNEEFKTNLDDNQIYYASRLTDTFNGKQLILLVEKLKHIDENPIKMASIINIVTDILRLDAQQKKLAIITGQEKLAGDKK